MDCPVARAHPLVSTAHAYWSQLPSVEGLPRKRDVDPLAIPKLLPYLLLAERLASGSFHLRVCGSHIVQRYGMECTGKSLEELELGDSLADFSAIFGHVLRSRAPLFFSGSLFWHGREHAVFREVLMPLADETGTPSFLLGCIVFDDPKQSS